LICDKKITYLILTE